MDYNNLNQRYVSLVQDNFYIYWDQFIDRENGGILNCINNYGDRKLSNNKFTWSQGRWLWILASLYELIEKKMLDKLNTEKLLHNMKDTYQFLSEKSIMEDGSCCFLLTKEGEKIFDEKEGKYNTSIYADCFALIGMAKYTRVVGGEQNIPKVQALYGCIKEAIESDNYLTAPYPIPKGYKIHGIPMILINTIFEYIEMCEQYGIKCEQEKMYVKSKIDFILTELFDEESALIYEHVSTKENKELKLLDRHINPGHTLEDLWFMVEYLKKYGDLSAYIEKICTIAKATFKLGWDKEYGGLLRFVDKTGMEPTGEYEDGDYVNLIKQTWDMKLWWPHSEILYLFLLLYKLTGDDEFKELYLKSEKYVFNTFPNEELGEWIQIRKRDGSPQEKQVALPVKDPFHILRNFIKIIELTA